MYSPQTGQILLILLIPSREPGIKAYSNPLTCGTNPIPSPMNSGATVITTLSTKAPPSSRGGARKNDDSTRDPPSIITLFDPRLIKIAGSELGGMRPAPYQHDLSISISDNVPSESSGTGITLAPASSNSFLRVLSTPSPQMSHGCLTFPVWDRVFHSDSIREERGNRSCGSRTRG